MSALEHVLGEFAARPGAARSPARVAAAEALRAHGLPGRHEENWRYADLRALDAAARLEPPEPPNEMLAPYPDELDGFCRLLFRNGSLGAAQARPACPGVTEIPFEEAVASEAPSAFLRSGDGRLGLTARLLAREPLALRLDGAVSLEILSVCAAGGSFGTDWFIDVAAGAQVKLVERRLSALPPAIAPAPTLDGHNLRVRIGPGASLAHVRLLQHVDPVVQHDTLDVSVAEGGAYRLRQVTAGAGSARSSVQVRLAGRDASFDLRAVTAARDRQVADAQYTILHEAPDTRSDQLFRGIASDRAHVACSADVQVDRAAPGARVQQSLRGLIDGKGAEVDLRPRLTINTNEVQATHGATTGRLDEQLLFYLLARGIDEPAARSLLKWAFLGEALGAIDPPALRRAAGLAAAARLSDAPARELLL